MSDDLIIDKFLREELNDAEKKAFDLQIQNDPEFAKEVAFRMQLQRASFELEKEKLKTAYQKSKNRKVAQNILLLVLGFLLAGLLYSLYHKVEEKNTPIDKIIPPLEEKTTPSNVDIAMKNEMDKIHARDKESFKLAGNLDWMNAFFYKEYEKCISILTRKLQSEEARKHEPNLCYYAGLILLYEKKNYETALEYLDCATDFKEDVKRHLLVACSLGNKTDRVQSLLEESPELKDQIPNILLGH